MPVVLVTIVMLLKKMELFKQPTMDLDVLWKSINHIVIKKHYLNAFYLSLCKRPIVL